MGSVGLPAVEGTSAAFATDAGGMPHPTVVRTTTDGGTTWALRPVPGATGRWSVDLIDPTHWRLTDGMVLMATDDGGSSWRTWTPSGAMTGASGRPVTLDFLTPLVGWAVGDPDRAPLRTVDGGHFWEPVVIVAGPYRLAST